MVVSHGDDARTLSLRSDHKDLRRPRTLHGSDCGDASAARGILIENANVILFAGSELARAQIVEVESWWGHAQGSSRQADLSRENIIVLAIAGTDDRDGAPCNDR